MGEILILIGVLAIFWLLAGAAYSLVIGLIRAVLKDIQRGNSDARNARRRERELDFTSERDSMTDKPTADIDEVLSVKIGVTDPDSGEPVEVIVRKLRYMEGLQAQVEAAPLLVDLARALADGSGAIDVDAVQDVLSRHADLWTELVALVSGRHATWLERLSDEDGQELSLAMWTLNSDCFSTSVAMLATSK
ncbi:MAG: hypothetical protein OXF94_06370 [Gammaproteobacteria bacterium]|nr:hypothetical protein [Gammaproteobacteria bacterium]